MLTNDDLRYLGGLSDGEAYFGVIIYKTTGVNSTFGYGVQPRFALDLGYPDSLNLAYFQRESGVGRIFPNRKSGHTWLVRAKRELKMLLELLEPYVRFERTRTKIHLLLELLATKPGKRRLSPARWRRELEIIIELRKLSKRRRNGNRHDPVSILKEFTALYLAGSEMKR